MQCPLRAWTVAPAGGPRHASWLPHRDELPQRPVSGPHFWKRPISPLGQFFGAYLGQDWSLEFSDPWSAVEAYVATEPPECRKPARHELTDLLAFPFDENELGRAVDRLGLNYRPELEHTTYRAWLEKVEQYLADHES